MKTRLIALFLVLALGCIGLQVAMADPEAWQGRTLNDFTVTTIDGSTFTLSESLQTHDLVLINLWATWCGPCRGEFPHLEAAWEQYGDRVDVIALSIEPDDTADVLKSFAAEYGLRFAVGRDETDIFSAVEGYAIPTTLIVNRDRMIVAVEIGSKSSVEEFTALFDELLSQYGTAPAAAAPAGGPCILHFQDPWGNPIQGVTVAFCNGEYTPVDTGADGTVAFDGSPSEYHVHLLAVPDGYVQPWSELYVTGDTFELTVVLQPA